MKKYTVVAGVNGVGKSSFTGAKADPSWGVIIDTDSITAGIGGDKLKGGRLAVQKIDYCLKTGVDFTQETTLSGSKTLRTIISAKEKGYYIRLFYIAVNSLGESLSRIENRVKKGGHNIPAADVTRRYEKRFEDLKKILPHCDETRFYDNENGFVYVGEYRNGYVYTVGDYAPDWIKELNACLTKAR